jgi:nitroreductase
VTEVNVDIHPLIRDRWSSRIFDPNRQVAPQMVDQLLEAARWAPSAGNGQPWRYIVFDQRDGTALEQARACLNPGNQVWATRAPVLLLAVAKTLRAGGKINSTALHDLGLANENIFLQAISMGLHCRPMAGFDSETAREVFSIPAEFEPVVMIAVGFPGTLTDLSDEIQSQEQKPRARKEIDTFAFLGTWRKKYLHKQESE